MNWRYELMGIGIDPNGGGQQLSSLCPDLNWCVLTCPLAGEAISNTKACQSLLDVPPLPRNLTTRIKAKLRITP